ncbi:hypothetical protein CLCR_02054 [Cladophialophora carrionii]|uniref:Uncharacterized protein n=1 Tax=Cladophialophora carrionii TaxID=86049 RepID=A0A1C1CEA2_9EURO|nr:hypothetical protein CLCR_02054 [Cladophialophora carrionii]
MSPTMSSTTANSTAIRTSNTTARPQTGCWWESKPVATSTGYGDAEIICAISESRGISPTIGLSFVSVATSEATLCQFTDTQTYARTCHKIKIYAPSETLYMSAAEDSKLISVVAENLEVETVGIRMTSLHRKYWSALSGQDYVRCLAFPDEVEVLKSSTAGYYFATCCFSAALKHIDKSRGLAFAPQTLRIRFESSEGSMMIDLSTMASLELIQNLQNAKSRECLFGLLNETLTPMGARFLRSNVLQPSTDAEKIKKRQEAVTELTTKGDMLFAIRSGTETFRREELANIS